MTIFDLPAKLNARLLAPAGKLECVAKQVLQQNAQQTRVAVDLQARLDRDLNLALRQRCPQVGDDILGEIAQAEVLVPDLRARQARELQ